MELAVAHGLEVRVVSLPPGRDPADDPAGFEQRLSGAESYLHYRVRLEIERASDRQEAFVRAREVLARAEDSPERHEALRLFADRLDLPRETLAGIAPARGRLGTGGHDGGERVVEAHDRLELGVLAACLVHPSLRALLAEVDASHFDDEAHRRFRDAVVGGGEMPADLCALRAELDARAAREAIDERTGTELILRLRERTLRRELSGADLARTTELQARLAKVRQALAELA